MLIKHILLINVDQFNKKVCLFIFNVFNIRCQMTANKFSSLFIAQNFMQRIHLSFCISTYFNKIEHFYVEFQ